MLGVDCWVMGVDCWVLTVGCCSIQLLLTKYLMTEDRASTIIESPSSTPSCSLFGQSNVVLHLTLCGRGRGVVFPLSLCALEVGLGPDPFSSLFCIPLVLYLCYLFLLSRFVVILPCACAELKYHSSAQQH